MARRRRRGRTRAGRTSDACRCASRSHERAKRAALVRPQIVRAVCGLDDRSTGSAGGGAMSERSEKPTIVVYGASGVVGGLVASTLAAGGANVVLAGRDRPRL